MKSIPEWKRMNKLSIRPTKPSSWSLTTLEGKASYQIYPPFSLGGIRIKRLHRTKHLELTVDDKLSWNDQYKFVNEKVAGGLASLRKLKNTITISVA